MAKKGKRRGEISRLFNYDMNLIVSVIFLIVFGLIMIYSASYYTASMGAAFRYNPAYFLHQSGQNTVFWEFWLC